MMEICVYNDWDHVPKAEAKGEDRVCLAWEGEYRKGDVIAFTGLTPDCFYTVKVDGAVDEALCLIRGEELLYPVPFYEKKTSYNPLAFFGNRHLITIEKAKDYEVYRYKNLALNPFDQHDVAFCFPHASANVETRGEAVFAARNAIDGCICPLSHGEWPYQSWGINRREDAAFRLDFGREVDIDRIELYTRADFPHDSYWTEGTLSFSDGSSLCFPMEKKVDVPHVLENLGKRKITWLTLDRLKKAPDESPFPALTQILVYGTESKELGKGEE